MEIVKSTNRAVYIEQAWTPAGNLSEGGAVYKLNTKEYLK